MTNIDRNNLIYKKMNNTQISIQLILQDLKYHRMIKEFEKLGIIPANQYTLEIYPIVALLQGIPEKEISDLWDDVYHNHMQKGLGCPANDTKALEKIAQICHRQLEDCRSIEKG